jgi:hypothetical protein
MKRSLEEGSKITSSFGTWFIIASLHIEKGENMMNLQAIVNDLSRFLDRYIETERAAVLDNDAAIQTCESLTDIEIVSQATD